jgi:hypothetical protein
MTVVFVDYVNHYAAPRIHDENLSHYYRATFLNCLLKIPGCRRKGMGKKGDEKRLKKAKKIGNFSRILGQDGVFTPHK